jgi:hypothetical protein
MENKKFVNNKERAVLLLYLILLSENLILLGWVFLVLARTGNVAIILLVLALNIIFNISILKQVENIKKINLK